MLPSNALFIRKGPRTAAGLPLPIAALYISLFAVAFWAYTAFWQDAPIRASDSGGYLDVARDITDFHIDRLHDRTPGYPILLLLTGSSLQPNRKLFFVSLLLHFTSIWLLAVVLNIAQLPATILIIFNILLLLPPYVESAAYVLTETLSEFLLVAGFSSLAFWYSMQRTIWILISSLSIAYAGLTRPTYQALALVLAAVLLVMSVLFDVFVNIRRQVLIAILMLICCSGVIIGGYIFFNYKKFDYFGMTPLIPFNLSTRTSRVLERLPEEHALVREALIRARDTDLIKRDGPHTGYYHMTSRMVPELVNITGLEWPQLSKYLTRMHLLLIFEAPFEYLLEVTRAFGSYWLPSSGTLSNMESRFIQLLWASIHFFVIIIFSLTSILFIGVSIYINVCRRSFDEQNTSLLEDLDLSKLQGFTYVLAGSIVMYSTVISCLIDAGESRYRIPTDGLIIFMCFLGIYFVRRLVSLSKIVFCYPSKL